MKNLKYIAPAIDVLALNTEGMIADSKLQSTTLTDTTVSSSTDVPNSADGKDGSYSVWDE